MPEPLSAPSTPTGSRTSWTPAEDAVLLKAVATFKGKNWKAVAAQLPNRTRAQCAHRYQKVLNPNLKKGAWSAEEDDSLLAAVHKHGPGKWSRIADSVHGRNGKQCRERWQNHLRSDVTKEPFSAAEDELIVRLRTELGNRWALIARQLPGRTENAVKNRWNAKLALDARVNVLPSTPRGPSLRAAVVNKAPASVPSTSQLLAAASGLGKRTSSLLSVLSHLSSESISTEAPGTPRSASTSASEPAGKKPKLSVEVPATGPSGLCAAGLVSQAVVVPQQATSAPTGWKAQLDKLTNPSLFAVGHFNKTDEDVRQSALTEPAASATQLDWLASLAAAQALAGLTSGKL